MNVVKAPFTPDQLNSLNGYQASGFVHEFTCGGDINCRAALVAKESGWVCPKCGYIQDWAHGFMADWSWKKLDPFLVEDELPPSDQVPATSADPNLP